MALSFSVPSLLFAPRVQAWQRGIDSLEFTQREVLSYLLAKAARTQWGEIHRLFRLQSYEDFASAVGPQTYQSLEKHIAEIRKGHPRILWPEPIPYLITPPPTTGAAQQYLPMPQEVITRNHLAAAADLMALRASQSGSMSAYTGRALLLAGGIEKRKQQSLLVGELSGVLQRNMPTVQKLRRVPGQEIPANVGWPERLEALAKEAARADIRTIVGTPEHIEQLIRLVLPLAREKHIMDVWPHLELIVHGGEDFSPYQERFDEAFKGMNTEYRAVHQSSVGTFGLQTLPESDTLTPVLNHGIFFEYLPLEHAATPQKQHLLPLWQVEKDTDYQLYVSTNAGFFRYRVGHTVRFADTETLQYRVTEWANQ